MKIKLLVNIFLLTGSVVLLAMSAGAREITNKSRKLELEAQNLEQKILVESFTTPKPEPGEQKSESTIVGASLLHDLMQAQSPTTTQAEVVRVTNVQVNSSDTGLEIILITQDSEKLEISPFTEGNSYIADIPNAQLQLATGDSFRAEKPSEQISEVTIGNFDGNRIRVIITGQTSVPQVELYDSPEEGLVFGVEKIAQQVTPTSQPETTLSGKPPEANEREQGAQTQSSTSTQTEVVRVTNVQVNPSDTGVEIILITQDSEKLEISPSTEGNSYIVDIPNAQLQIATGDSFRSEKPTEQINEVTVINLDANKIRVTITGQTSVPEVEFFDSPEEGLVFFAKVKS